MSKKKHKRDSKKGGQAVKPVKYNFKNVKWGAAAILIVIIVIYIFNPQSTADKPLQLVEKNLNESTPFEFQKQGELSFNSTDGNFITQIDIEIADDDAERATGLMNRYKLEENQGMMFVFPYEDYQSFWMKNTILPLDMIFVNKEREIVKIHKNTKPFADNISYPSERPAIYVIEVNAGFTEKYDIKAGDKIVWRKL